MLRDVGAPRSTVTVEMITRVQPNATEHMLRRTAERDPTGQYWMYLMVGETEGVLFPISIERFEQGRHDPVALLMTIHTRLSAWWLAQAWRVEELIDETIRTWDAGHPVSAALTSRALIETAAVLRHDVDRLHDAWDRTKRSGALRVGPAPDGLHDMLRAVDLHELGGVFSDVLPELKDAISPVKRRSVLSDLKGLDRELRELYEWLSNVAHPSFGTMLAYGSPPQVHETGTHTLRAVAGDPADPVLTELRPTHESRVRSVGGMSLAACSLAGGQATETLERALAMIDDLGLTSDASSWAPWPYWRNIRKANKRNALCPCRLGRKAKICGHEWGQPATSATTESC